MATSFPNPIGGASLLLSFRLKSKTVLIVGSGALAASRAFAALEADSSVTILTKGEACEELKWRAQKGQLTILDWNSMPCSSSSPPSPLEALEHYLDTTTFTLACITDTIIGDCKWSLSESQKIYSIFNRRNIPVNFTDMPALCDFSFAATHRFHNQGSPTSLQVGVTTNGQGCRLAGRIKREIISRMPKSAAGAVEKVGKMRKMTDGVEDAEEEGEDSGVTTPNRPVPTRTPSEMESADEARRRRMKWVAQVSEYWPLEKLSALEETEIREVLAGDATVPAAGAAPTTSLHGLGVRPPPGRIYLVGSGPGHPSLLTIATHTALTKLADIVLSDKLVPAPVLALIPPNVEVKIARKFPGNADGAQEELMDMAVEAASQGRTVVRVSSSLLRLLSPFCSFYAAQTG